MRKDVHVLREVWQAVEDGRLTQGEADEMLRDHLLSLCSTCSSEYRAFTRGEQRSRYAAAFERSLDWAAAREGETRVGARRARADLAELLSLPEDRRIERIARARRRFRGVHLAEALLAESWGCLPGDPAGALHFATLAEAAVVRSRGPGAKEARVLAFAYEGNALRILGRLAESRRAFALGRHQLSREGLPNDEGEAEAVTELTVYARFDWLEGAFHRAVRDFAPAELLLCRSVLFFGLAHDEESLSQVLVTLGELYRMKGDVDEAIATIGVVLGRIDADRQPDLYFTARFNHALYLAEAGLFVLAREEADQILPLAPRDDEHVGVRLLALEGRIAFGLGDHRAAARAFEAERAKLIEQGVWFDAAIASIDLALVYRTTNRLPELRRVAEEMALFFDASDLHAEAAAALILLQEAVRDESISTAFLEELRLYLEQARWNPQEKFRQPS
jgi:tetratricopeptide (TPR) repeat protein